MTAKNFSKFAILALVLAVLVIGGIKPTGKPEDVLRLVVIPSNDEVTKKEQYRLFIEYLEEETNTQIEIITVADYAAAVEAMKYGHAELARFGPASYVVAAREVEIEPMAAGIKAGTGVAGYWAYIISKPGLETLDGVTFAFVDPGSSSGYLYPNNYIEKSGIQLGKIMFAGSHPAVIEAVKNDSVDAGAVASNRWEYALQEGVIAEGELEIFWSSVLIPSGPWTIRADMDNDLKEAFVKALLDAPEDAALSLGHKDTGFIRITDADYDVVREIK